MSKFATILLVAAIGISVPAYAKDDPNLVRGYYGDGAQAAQLGQDIYNALIAEKGQEIPNTPDGEQMVRNALRGLGADTMKAAQEYFEKRGRGPQVGDESPKDSEGQGSSGHDSSLGCDCRDSRD